MSRWRWVLLIFELFLFALILVLPQVDLPDFTVHGRTAPVFAKARVLPTPNLNVATTRLRSHLLQPAGKMPNSDFYSMPTSVVPASLSQLCILLC